VDWVVAGAGVEWRVVEPAVVLAADELEQTDDRGTVLQRTADLDLPVAAEDRPEHRYRQGDGMFRTTDRGEPAVDFGLEIGWRQQVLGDGHGRTRGLPGGNKARAGQRLPAAHVIRLTNRKHGSLSYKKPDHFSPVR
jgi:hypothetical protein